MASDEEDLNAMAQNGVLDYSKWPALLERLVPRLEHIVYNDFPLPSIPLSGSVPPGLKRGESPASKGQPTDRDEPPEKKVKRDADGILEDTPRKVGDLSVSVNATLDPPRGSLPPLLLTLLQTIISTLRTSFPVSPPHTSQRLAELLLHPNNHYCTLPSYLRALDRIVSVASPASIFPLKNPSINLTGTNGSLLNGTSSPSPDPEDDVDFIGGAELTEILWKPKPQPLLADAGAEGMQTTANGAPTNASDLRTESTSLIEGPNGLGGVETVTVANGIPSSTSAAREDAPASTSPLTSTTTRATATPPHGITQGELLCQEQEAGIVPVLYPIHSSQGQGSSSNRITRSSAAASAAASRAFGTAEPVVADDMSGIETPAPEEEIVHVRGPGVIGMEDMGPQALGSGLEGGITVEGALGGSREIMTPVESTDTSSQGTGATQELDGLNLGEEGVLVEKPDTVHEPILVEKEQKNMDDKDAMVTDADAVSPGQTGMEEGTDIVDTTSL